VDLEVTKRLAAAAEAFGREEPAAVGGHPERGVRRLGDEEILLPAIIVGLLWGQLPHGPFGVVGQPLVMRLRRELVQQAADQGLNRLLHPAEVAEWQRRRAGLRGRYELDRADPVVSALLAQERFRGNERG